MTSAKEYTFISKIEYTAFVDILWLPTNVLCLSCVLCKIQHVFNLYQRILTLTCFIRLSVKVTMAEYESIMVLMILKILFQEIFSIICCLHSFKYLVININSIIHLHKEHIFYTYWHLKWSLTLAAVHSLWQKVCFFLGFVRACKLRMAL